MVFYYKIYFMSNAKNNKIIYSRLLESVLVHKLKLFGVVVIEGPKQTGKTYLGKKLQKVITMCKKDMKCLIWI